MPAVSRAPRPGEAELRAAVAGRGVAESRRSAARFLPQPPAAPGAAPPRSGPVRGAAAGARILGASCCVVREELNPRDDELLARNNGCAAEAALRFFGRFGRLG